MTSKEIIKRLVAHREPPRFGYDFRTLSDFAGAASRRNINMPDNPYNGWGDLAELKALTGFHGEVRRDFFGNSYGRFNGKTKGECIRGVIQDWDDYEFPLPEFDRPDVYPSELPAGKYAGKAVFYSPVDIRKVLTTGGRDYIEARSPEMCRLFSEAGGGWIAKDYPSYGDVGVDPVRAGWRRRSS